MTKQQLRKQFSEKRQALEYDTWQENSQAICQNFFTYFDLGDIKKLHIFLPILKQNEINTWLIIQQIFRSYPEITLVTSKSDFKTSSMESYLLEADTKTVENRWGIPEPVAAVKCPDDTIDMILMPLLGFDQRGYRVGYGKGFYDRFLQQRCRTEIIKIGLSQFEPVNEIDDVNEYDVKMNYCVTNRQVWSRC